MGNALAGGALSKLLCRYVIAESQSTLEYEKNLP